MEFSEVMQVRRSIRKYKSDAIPEHYITEVINAARLAPSVSNIQSTRYVILKSPEAIASLANYTTPFVTKAPVVIVCCTYKKAWQSQNEKLIQLVENGVFKDNAEDSAFYESSTKNGQIDRMFNEDIGNSYLWQHAAIAMEHMALKAADLGLGSCYVGLVDRTGVRKLVGLSEDYEIVALLPIGYPDQNVHQRPRLALSELILQEL